MSPQRKAARRGTDWKPPRDRREVVVAVIAGLAVIVATFTLIWFLRPNRNSGSSSVTNTVATTTITPGVSTTTATTTPTTTGAPATTAPASTSKP